MAIYRSASVYAKHDWNNVKIVILQSTKWKNVKKVNQIKIKKGIYSCCMHFVLIFQAMQ